MHTPSETSRRRKWSVIAQVAFAGCLALAGCRSGVHVDGSGGGSPSDGSSTMSTANSAASTASGGAWPTPDLQCHPLPDEHAVFAPIFSQYSGVFGVHLFATAATPCPKLQHAAGVMAQYLDNDENGTPDDPLVLQAMLEVSAALVMFATEQELENSDPGRIFGAPYALQDLFGTETHPEGSTAETGFDATLEEVLHLISDKGHARAYPARLGLDIGTDLSEAMDIARGGQFTSVPNRYPPEAWYHYDDVSCDYRCMATEYFYWSLTSILGAQSYAGRPEWIADEWELYNEQLVKTTDVAVYALMTDPALKLPTTLPDGKYAPSP